MKNAKRILALIGVFLLLAMYICTMIFALIKSPVAGNLFKGSLYCTFVIPVLIYAGMMIFKNSENKKEWPIDKKEDDTTGSDSSEK